jgi:hypothetical protein
MANAVVNREECLWTIQTLCKGSFGPGNVPAGTDPAILATWGIVSDD